jgi:hypothetical protein
MQISNRGKQDFDEKTLWLNKWTHSQTQKRLFHVPPQFFFPAQGVRVHVERAKRISSRQRMAGIAN